MKKTVSIILVLCVVATVAYLVFGAPNSRTVAMRESLQKTDQIFIYEGLPHQMFEAELLATEQKREDVREIAGYSFYTPQTLVAEDRMESLKQWLSAEESFSEFSGEKKCGGFHPDYAVVWKGKKRDFAVLICFGCGEVIFTDGNDKLRYDLNSKVKDKLREWLADYAKNRPSSGDSSN